MTALKEYQRLETTGLWKPEAGEQRREVMVSFGDATLVLTDTAGRPLTHWSLSAVHRINPGTRPALFAPSPDASEVLELDAAEMIDAIEKVRRLIEKARARPGRLRWVFRLGLPLCVLAAGWMLGPELLIRQTSAVVPPSKRAAFGAEILGTFETQLGPRCDASNGRLALDRLKARLFGAGMEIMVLPQGLGTAAALPGGLIVLDQNLVENTDDPLVVAGHILAAQSGRTEEDPLAPVLRHLGTGATVQLLTTGDLPPGGLARYAREFLISDRSSATTDALVDTFDRTRVAATPYFASLGVEMLEETTSDPTPVLTDGEWVALQGICLD